MKQYFFQNMNNLITNNKLKNKIALLTFVKTFKYLYIIERFGPVCYNCRKCVLLVYNKENTDHKIKKTIYSFACIKMCYIVVQAV